MPDAIVRGDAEGPDLAGEGEPPVALVIGATGYVGREVVPAAVTAGARVVAHVRPENRNVDQWRRRFVAAGAAVDETAWDATAMRITIGRLAPDVVFSLIGTTKARGREAPAGSVENYETVDVGLNLLLIEAILGSGVRPRVVYLSSVGVGPDSMSDYIRARWTVEQTLRESGLPHVIARPSFITGRDRDRFRPAEYYTARLADPILAGLGRLGAYRLRDRYRSTTNVDLAARLVDLALDPAQSSGVVESEGLR